MAWRRPGDKPLSEPMMVSLPMRICVTRPQWVKSPLDLLLAWHIFSAKLSLEPMLTYCQLDPWEGTSVKFESKYKTLKEMNLEISVEWQRFCSGLQVLTNKINAWLLSPLLRHWKYYSLVLTHPPLDKMAAILQTVFSDAFSWMKSFVFWLKFHWSFFWFLMVRLTIIQHWFG